MGLFYKKINLIPAKSSKFHPSITLTWHSMIITMTKTHCTFVFNTRLNASIILWFKWTNFLTFCRMSGDFHAMFWFIFRLLTYITSVRMMIAWKKRKFSWEHKKLNDFFLTNFSFSISLDFRMLLLIFVCTWLDNNAVRLAMMMQENFVC